MILIILYLNIPRMLFVQQDHVKLFLINDHHKYGRCVRKGRFFVRCRNNYVIIWDPLREIESAIVCPLGIIFCQDSVLIDFI